MPKRDFNVAIMHGHSNAWQTVEQWVQEAGFTPRVLIKEFEAGVIFERLRDIIWDEIHCVVVIMSADDKINKKIFRARQNVVFELGYCFGAFDSLDDNGHFTAEDAIIFLKEENVEIFANIHGLTYVEYNRRSLWRKKQFFTGILNSAFEKARQVYRELR